MRETSARTGSRTASTSLPVRSPWMARVFEKYNRRYVAKHVHAVRMSRDGYRPRGELTGPLLIVLNHPSWWDPLVCLTLAGLWSARAPYAPIDAAALAKYPILERLGMFGVEPGTARGASSFLRRGLAVLGDPGAMLWVTAQGRFVDPRARPIRLRPGIGHLLRRLDAGSVVPLALEYPFWDERSPEALARFGPPITLGVAAARAAPDAWTARLEDALETAQDALARDALTRDPARFETIVSGVGGVGGIYDAWRRLKAFARGETFVAEHSGIS